MKYSNLKSQQRQLQNLSILNKLNQHIEYRSQYRFNEFQCPITLQIMKDPVILTDGITYQRQAIQSWLKNSKISPVKGILLQTKFIIPNIALKNIIQDYVITNNLLKSKIQKYKAQIKKEKNKFQIKKKRFQKQRAILNDNLDYQIFNQNKYISNAAQNVKKNLQIQTNKSFKGDIIPKIINFENGRKYIGETLNGKMNGYGKLELQNGDAYFGEFQNDQMNGYGRYCYSKEQLKRDYYGNQIPFHILFQGYMKNEKINGFGYLLQSDDSFYQGYFQNDLKHGQGTISLPDKSKIIGIWKQDSLEEKILIQLQNGDLQQGSCMSYKNHGINYYYFYNDKDIENDKNNEQQKQENYQQSQQAFFEITQN